MITCFSVIKTGTLAFYLFIYRYYDLLFLPRSCLQNLLVITVHLQFFIFLLIQDVCYL